MQIYINTKWGRAITRWAWSLPGLIVFAIIWWAIIIYAMYCEHSTAFSCMLSPGFLLIIVGIINAKDEVTVNVTNGSYERTRISNPFSKNAFNKCSTPKKIAVYILLACILATFIPTVYYFKVHSGMEQAVEVALFPIAMFLFYKFLLLFGRGWMRFWTWFFRHVTGKQFIIGAACLLAIAFVIIAVFGGWHFVQGEY